MRTRTKLAIAATILLAVLLLGPRVETDIPPADPIQLPDDLDAYLAGEEAAAGPITPNTEKTIVWRDAPNQPTDLALVYVHGFSATRQELAPVPQRLAEALDANLFMTRLTGHGQDGEALARATAADWAEDVAEAVAVGRRLGRRLVVFGVSTGGSLALWLAATVPESADALVLVSPNLALHDSRSEMMLWPWGGALLRLLAGPERSWEPTNELNGRFWTTRYPSKALLQVIATVEMARTSPIETVEIPTLVFYSPGDQVLDPAATEAMFDRLGSASKELAAMDSDDPKQHVLAGDILSPRTNDEIVQQSAEFLRQALGLPDPETLPTPDSTP